MSRKNRRKNMTRPLHREQLTMQLNKPHPTQTPATRTESPTTPPASVIDMPAAPQATPFIEVTPRGSLRVGLTEECWCEFVNIASHKLLSDPSYQREIRDGHVTEILSEWDARVMNFPKVSLREDGSYYIFDGAHTKTATDRLNDGREHMVPCILYHNLKLEDEAYLFAMQSGCSREVAFGYKLRARILSGDKKAIGFEKCNAVLGLKIVKDDRSSRNVISAVNTAYRLFETWGAERYEEVMQLILDTWGGDSSSLSQVMIEAVSRFYRAYGRVFDRRRFIRDLSSMNARTLAEKGRGAMHDTAGYLVNLLVQVYNRKGGKACVKPEWLVYLDSMPRNQELNLKPQE